ncbi:MAG: hypothetical protein WDN30_04975 [Pararobbsia sp.]
MNKKQLAISLLLVATTGFTGIAMAGSGGGARGSYPAPIVQTVAPSTTAHAANCGMKMDNCSMMDAAHANDKVSMQTNTATMQATVRHHAQAHGGDRRTA